MECYSHKAKYQGIQVWLLQKEDADMDNVDSPYGPLTYNILPVEDSDAAGPAGAEPKTFPIKIVCPMALLCLACMVCPSLPLLLKACGTPCGSDRAQRHMHICIYFDEVKPGNNNRPDIARAYDAYYWTFLDFPEWVIQQTQLWFLLAYISSKDTKRVRGNESQIMRLFRLAQTTNVKALILFKMLYSFVLVFS